MKYGEFKLVWNEAFNSSGLSAPFGFSEKLDLESMDRIYEIHIQPMGGFDAPPFTVMGTLSWRWHALHTAWAATNEEDMLTELFGRREGRHPMTSRPWLRIDIKLSATLYYGKEIPLPPPAAWKKWSREAITRLQSIEPIVPKETVRERRNRLEVLAWSGEPSIEASCAIDGVIKLKSVKWAAWQSVNVPRHFDHPDRKPDPHPHQQLMKMFGRVRASIQAWKQVVDHLT